MRMFMTARYFTELFDSDNTREDVWADSVYRSGESLQTLHGRDFASIFSARTVGIRSCRPENSEVTEADRESVAALSMCLVSWPFRTRTVLSKANISCNQIADGEVVGDGSFEDPR